MDLLNIISVGIFNSKISRPNTRISQERKTTAFELEIPLERGGISYVNEHCRPIDENLIIVAKPGQIRHTKFPYKCYFVHFEVKDEYYYRYFGGLRDFIEPPEISAYFTVFEEMYKSYAALDKTEELILNSLLLKLLYMLVKDAKPDPSSGFFVDNGQIVRKAIAYIEENIASNLKLEVVASCVGLSPNYFHNVFKYATGKTLRVYVEEKRIKKAVYLLQTTDRTLTDIAYECGFSSQSYFNYVFKKRMKLMPKKYVKKLNDAYEI